MASLAVKISLGKQGKEGKGDFIRYLRYSPKENLACYIYPLAVTQMDKMLLLHLP